MTQCEKSAELLDIVMQVLKGYEDKQRQAEIESEKRAELNPTNEFYKLLHSRQLARWCVLHDQNIIIKGLVENY